MGLGYSQQAKLSLSVTDGNERVLWKGYSFSYACYGTFYKGMKGKG